MPIEKLRLLIFSIVDILPALDVIFGSPVWPDVAGHLFYFLTLLYPLAGGKNILKTPVLVYPF